MHLSKHHGLGNDFLVLLRDDVVPMPDDVAAALAARLCHRTRGVGADGLLIGGPPVRRIACDLQMWLYNADGSRAEMSGNGIRCLAQAVLRDRGLTEATLAISTDAGLRRVDAKVVSDDELWASVDMGAMSVVDAPDGWHVLDLDPLRPVAHVSIGNPHAVVLVDDADAVDLVAAGRAVPEVNLEIIAAGPESGAITMRVHERGVGITEACGTGACAAAWAARGWGLAGDRVVVHMLGGDGEVTIEGDVVTLAGPAVHIADIQISDSGARA
jgi:diaminopimelate epimerase